MDARPIDLARLIAIVAEEVMAASRRPTAACACHAVAEDCCPTRLRQVIDAGAARLGYHATSGATGDVAALIDHTLLKPDATRQDIENLCQEAATHHFANRAGERGASGDLGGSRAGSRPCSGRWS